LVKNNGSINDINDPSSLSIDFLKITIPYFVPLWIELFSGVILVVLVFYIIKSIIRSSKKYGFLKTVYRFSALTLFLVGLLGITTLPDNSNLNPHTKGILLVLSIIVVIGGAIYLIKNQHLTRRYTMEDREKLKNSAAILVNQGKFLYDAFNENYSSIALKTAIDTPLKELEEEIKRIRNFINTIKE
jgi:hypothetical protein